MRKQYFDELKNQQSVETNHLTDDFFQENLLLAQQEPAKQQDDDRYLKHKGKESKQIILDKQWKHVLQDYKLIELVGKGSFGQVCKAQHKTSGKIYAIKLIKDAFKSDYHARKTIREVSILRQLSAMKGNVFTTKLYDIIIPNIRKTSSGTTQVKTRMQMKKTFDFRGINTPTERSRERSKNRSHKNNKYFSPVSSLKRMNILSPQAKKEQSDLNNNQNVYDVSNMDIIFLVMDFTNNDMKKVLLTVPNGTKLYEDHVIVILYNLLCCLNYLHSANLMHRDLKPANILLDDSSQVLVCDFGISRTQPIRKPQHQGSSSQKQTRSLSAHVCSRWYRAPEVILQENYDKGCDLWSLGCILGELVNCSEKYVTKMTSLAQDDRKVVHDYVSGRFLFPGTSCFPSSPCQAMIDSKSDDLNIVSSNDQLQKINQFLGKLDEHDLNFIQDKAGKQYSESITSAEPKRNLFKQFKYSDPELIKILIQLLEFNPNNRISALECLKNPIFDQIRVQQLEQPAPYKVTITNDFSDQFDYENGVNTGVTSDQLRNKIKLEVIEEMNAIRLKK